MWRGVCKRRVWAELYAKMRMWTRGHLLAYRWTVYLHTGLKAIATHFSFYGKIFQFSHDEFSSSQVGKGNSAKWSVLLAVMASTARRHVCAKTKPHVITSQVNAHVLLVSRYKIFCFFSKLFPPFLSSNDMHEVDAWWVHIDRDYDVKIRASTWDSDSTARKNVSVSRTSLKFVIQRQEFATANKAYMVIFFSFFSIGYFYWMGS